MCVYIEMRPILCTKIHILCATTCAHSFCNKHRLFVFSFLIYILHVVCECFFFSFSPFLLIILINGVLLLMMMILMLMLLLLCCCFFYVYIWAYTYIFFDSVKFRYSCFWVASNWFWHLSFVWFRFFLYPVWFCLFWPNHVIFQVFRNYKKKR